MTYLILEDLYIQCLVIGSVVSIVAIIVHPIRRCKHWILRRKIEKKLRKITKETPEEEKKKIIEEIKKISIKQAYRRKAEHILRKHNNPYSDIEDELRDIKLNLSNINITLRRFKGYQKPEYPPSFVSKVKRNK